MLDFIRRLTRGRMPEVRKPIRERMLRLEPLEVRSMLSVGASSHSAQNAFMEVAPNCRTLQMLSSAAKLSSEGVSYDRQFESPEASWSSRV